MLTQEDLIKLRRASEKDSEITKEVTDKYEKLFENYNRLLDLEKQKHEKLNEMERALIIKALWPDAFKSGGCRVRLDGDNNFETFKNIKKVKFKIRRCEDGEERCFDLLDIPKSLFMHTLNGNCCAYPTQKKTIRDYYNKNYKEELDAEDIPKEGGEEDQGVS